MPSPNGADVVLDLLIVGAGPCGLYGGYYAGFRGLRVGICDILTEPGGQISAMYPEKQIFDVAGFPHVRGRELVDRLVEQVEPFRPQWLLGRQATTLADGGQRWLVTLSDGTVVDTAAILVTAGIGSFSPRPLPALSEYEGRGLRYFVREPSLLAEHDVVIIGGGDSAFDWAVTLVPLARSVTVVHRRDAFRAHRHTVDVVRDSTARLVTSAEVTAAHGVERIEAVDITMADGTTERAPADTVVAALGFVAQMGPLMSWGLELSGRSIVVDTRMMTNRHAIFAAGDVNDYSGKVRLIAVGFGEAATAVNNAAALIDAAAPLFPGHSTEQSTVSSPGAGGSRVPASVGG